MDSFQAAAKAEEYRLAREAAAKAEKLRVEAAAAKKASHASRMHPYESVCVCKHSYLPNHSILHMLDRRQITVAVNVEPFQLLVRRINH